MSKETNGIATIEDVLGVSGNHLRFYGIENISGLNVFPRVLPITPGASLSEMIADDSLHCLKILINLEKDSISIYKHDGSSLYESMAFEDCYDSYGVTFEYFGNEDTNMQLYIYLYLSSTENSYSIAPSSNSNYNKCVKFSELYSCGAMLNTSTNGYVSTKLVKYSDILSIGNCLLDVEFTANPYDKVTGTPVTYSAGTYNSTYNAMYCNFSNNTAYGASMPVSTSSILYERAFNNLSHYLVIADFMCTSTGTIMQAMWGSSHSSGATYFYYCLPQYNPTAANTWYTSICSIHNTTYQASGYGNSTSGTFSDTSKAWLRRGADTSRINNLLFGCAVYNAQKNIAYYLKRYRIFELSSSTSTRTFTISVTNCTQYFTYKINYVNSNYVSTEYITTANASVTLSIVPGTNVSIVINSKLSNNYYSLYVSLNGYSNSIFPLPTSFVMPDANVTMVNSNLMSTSTLTIERLCTSTSTVEYGKFTYGGTTYTTSNYSGRFQPEDTLNISLSTNSTIATNKLKYFWTIYNSGKTSDLTSNYISSRTSKSISIPGKIGSTITPSICVVPEIYRTSSITTSLNNSRYIGYMQVNYSNTSGSLTFTFASTSITCSNIGNVNSIGKYISTQGLTLTVNFPSTLTITKGTTVADDVSDYNYNVSSYRIRVTGPSYDLIKTVSLGGSGVFTLPATGTYTIYLQFVYLISNIKWIGTASSDSYIYATIITDANTYSYNQEFVGKIGPQS